MSLGDVRPSRKGLARKMAKYAEKNWQGKLRRPNQSQHHDFNLWKVTANQSESSVAARQFQAVKEVNRNRLRFPFFFWLLGRK